MKDDNGMNHDENDGRFTSGGSTAAEQKRADELVGNDTEISIDELKKQERYDIIQKRYKESTNEKIVEYVYSVLNDGIKKDLEIVAPSEREIVDLKSKIGVDVTGFSRYLTPDSVRHIENRHGLKGNADASMSDVNDIARMEYVLHNYDKIVDEGITSSNYKNSDGLKAKAVRYEMRINGSYYVAEVVPDSKRKHLIIVSAYKNKNR